MDELKLKYRIAALFFVYNKQNSTAKFSTDIWPKIEQLIESEKSKAATQAVNEYKAAQNVKYTPEQIGQRGPDDFNFNQLIPESIL